MTFGIKMPRLMNPHLSDVKCFAYQNTVNPNPKRLFNHLYCRPIARISVQGEGKFLVKFQKKSLMV
jgi:hypothetical protein